MYDLQEVCLPENYSLTGEEMKKDTQNILNNVVLYTEIVELNRHVKEKIKWILQESGGEKQVSDILRMLTRDVKASGVCAIKKDCTEMRLGVYHSDVYTIRPDKSNVKVYCDMNTDGGGWTDNDQDSGADCVGAFGPWTMGHGHKHISNYIIDVKNREVTLLGHRDLSCGRFILF
ncbi:Hypothetical predicted protein [Mytilus galloprovincialis]|uniref:Fibrinogen C-terminal domain-containing protein n=1 Tax=Mytilus galloprovincialis TaxID=29158 RepID=A0A8B6CBC7_MYTGA|nr:Hypothetical predicted protein [Mytilus galloprovincialis]